MATTPTWGPYIILKEIGRGGFAIVKLARHIDTNEYWALKLIMRDDLDEDQEEIIDNEANVMRRLDHPNVLRLLDYDNNCPYLTRSGKTVDMCYMALELWSGGELFDWVAETGAFSEPVARYYFQQLIAGLHHLHIKGTSHRDLKLENILLDSKYNLKIADFGFASVQPKNTTAKGTTGYLAPEVLKYEAYSGVSIDIFAAGVILFTMVSQRPPFISALDKDGFYKLIISNQADRFWQKHERINPDVSYSAEFKELVTMMLDRDPWARPSLAEIQESAWFKGEVPTHEQIIEEFADRKNELDNQSVEVVEKDGEQGPGGIEGVYVYRSMSEDKGEEIKVDLKNRTAAQYIPQFQRCTEFFSTSSAETLYKTLIMYQEKYALNWEFSEDDYSAVIMVKEPENVKMHVNILDVEEEVKRCVEVVKLKGDRFKFSQAYDTLKKFFSET